MGDGALIFRLCYQHTPAVRIQLVTKHIENEIPLAYKADAKALTVFRFGCAAFRAPAFKIPDAIKI